MITMEPEFPDDPGDRFAKLLILLAALLILISILI